MRPPDGRVTTSDTHVTDGLAKGEGEVDGDGDGVGDDAAVGVGEGVGIGSAVGAGLAQPARTTANKSPRRYRIAFSDAPGPLGVPAGPTSLRTPHYRQMMPGPGGATNRDELPEVARW
jgi:hypothetical protein